MYGPMAAFISRDGHDITPVAVFVAAVCLLSAAAIALTRESHRTSLAEDDTGAAPAAVPAQASAV
jgi:hypothetical protein